jgi:5,10-methylenetetrahydromethanopterin reductase
LGISSGDPFFLETVGIKQRKPVTSVREALSIIRGLLGGERVEFRGECFSCSGAELRFKPSNEIPVYIGGRRGRMLQLAGELAEGALINAAHTVDIRDSIVSVKRGLSSRERSQKGFDIVAYMAVSINTDLAKARKAARGVVAFIASSAPEESLAHHGVSEESVEAVRTSLRKGEITGAREAVTNEMLDGFSVCGPVDELVSRVEGLRRIGITRVVVGSPIGPKPIESLKVAARELI